MFRGDEMPLEHLRHVEVGRDTRGHKVMDVGVRPVSDVVAMKAHVEQTESGIAELPKHVPANHCDSTEAAQDRDRGRRSMSATKRDACSPVAPRSNATARSSSPQSTRQYLHAVVRQDRAKRTSSSATPCVRPMAARLAQ